MNNKQTKYELLKEKSTYHQRCTFLQIGILLALCILCSIVVFSTWSTFFLNRVNVPLNSINIPQFWVRRALKYSELLANNTNTTNACTKIDELTIKSNHSASIIHIGNETIYPSKLGNFISSANHSKDNEIKQRLVCYYAAPSTLNQPNELYPDQIDPFLCTHINVGIINIEKNRIVIGETLHLLFKQMTALKHLNGNLMIMLWIGGPADTNDFIDMIENHANRKEFIRSIKNILEMYRLDGIDLDWEFPSTYDRQKQHFSQLLHEIRREYEREHRTYLLSVAVAAPEGIAYFAYDIAEINAYCDYVNIMTYDYHFYSKSSPFTGLNAPLYKRNNEQSIFVTLNINASAMYWHQHGLDKSKIVIGMPTYGHSFRLVNPFNNKIGSPASGYGRIGSYGFVTYSDVCWFMRSNFFVNDIYDKETCSPYVCAGTEWISYENERSISCKTEYVKKMGFGGAMIFSLNTDDYSSYCYYGQSREEAEFPLTRAIKSILF